MVQRYATLSGKKLVNPEALLDSAKWNDTPRDFWKKANGYTCPLGKEPGRAFVLLSRRDLVALDRNALHSLVWTTEDGTTTFANLVIVRADCMTLSHNSDPGATYLVELADCRRQLTLSCINAQYNVRIPAPPATSGTSLYYPESLDGSGLWTWQTMVSNIWGQLPSIAGAAPTLPYSPDGTPDGFRFIGVSAWDALHVVLEKIGCAVRFNPLTGVLTIIRRGVAQAGLAAAQAALTGRNVYTYDPLDSARADTPETVRVFFHKRAEDGHGTEKDTPRTDNWEMNAVHEEDAATGIAGAEAGTVLPVWDDLPAIVDETGALTNAAALTARAAEIAGNIAAQFNLESPHRTHYGGLITTILPGSEVSQAVWRDYSDGHGLVTEVHREAPEKREGGGLVVAGERLAAPDLGRETFPQYPHVAQIVQVYHSSGSQGETVSANGDGLHPGRVKRWVGGTMATLEDCWILFVDNYDNKSGDISAIDGDFYGPGRLCGIETSGTTKPIYLVRKGGMGLSLLRGTSNEHMGETTDWQIEVNVSWHQGDEDPGDTIIVHDPDHSWQDVPSSSDVLAFYNEADDRWEVLFAERVYLYGRAVLGGTLCQETSMITVSGFTGLATGEFLQPPDTEPTTGIVNPRKHAGPNGAGVTLRRADNNMPNPTWEIVDVDLYEIEYVTDVLLDGLALKQVKKTAYAEICSTSETESTITTGTECE